MPASDAGARRSRILFLEAIATRLEGGFHFVIRMGAEFEW
jgi:hypothetical protein